MISFTILSFQVWTACRCRTLGDYHDIYLKSDVYLLADVFENFRFAALDTYGLDPAHYFTLPGFSWDALLRTTAIELELLTDIDMHLFIERGKSCVCVFVCACDYIPVADWLKNTRR